MVIAKCAVSETEMCQCCATGTRDIDPWQAYSDHLISLNLNTPAVPNHICPLKVPNQSLCCLTWLENARTQHPAHELAVIPVSTPVSS